MRMPLAAINGILFFLFAIRIPLLPFDNENPMPPVIAMQGIKMNNPGITISPLTIAIDSFDPNNSTDTVDIKKIAMHKVAITAALRWIIIFICLHSFL